jgi:hypothetical protein
MLILYKQLSKNKIVILNFKLIAPNKELIPDKCKAKIAKSTLGPLWLCTPLNGG